MSTALSKKDNRLHQNAFSTYYLLKNNSELENLFKEVSGKSFLSWLTNLFNKASDSLGSIMMYPMIREKFVNNFALSDSYIPIVMGGASWNVNVSKLSDIPQSIIIGHISLNAYSYRDFEPYTQIQLHLPYLGFVDLPPSEVFGKTLYVKYAFDWASGTATAFIEVQGGTNQYILATKTGKIGIEIAWGKDNSIENTRNIINTIVSTGISLATIYATKGTSEIAQSVAGARAGAEIGKSLLSIANSTQTKYERGGSSGSYGFTYDNPNPYLIIKKKVLVPVNEDDYARIYGKPLYESRVLAQVSGFTIVDDIHLENLGSATEPEMREIENLLKTGVHL